MILEMYATAVLYSGALASASRGNSEEARFAVNQTANGLSRLKSSNAFGFFTQKAFDDLNLTFQECREEDWDGYQAVPVSQDSYSLAAQFLMALPLGTENPSIGAEADGQLTMEWYRSPRRTLSISISPDGELHYAALIGARKAYGTEPFYGEAPATILSLIHQITTA